MKKILKLSNIFIVLALILLILTVFLGAKKSNTDVNNDKNNAHRFLKKSKIATPLSSSFAGSYNSLAGNGKDINGIIFGDEISDTNIGTYIGKRLHSTFNTATDKSWSPVNLSVKGNNISNILTYLLNYNDKSNQQVKSTAYTKPYWIIMTGLNDSKNIDADTFEYLYRMAVRQGVHENIDVYCLTEPPNIDMQTGQPIIDAKYTEIRNRIEKVSKEEGGIFVDVYSEFLKLSNLKNYTLDGIVPNDNGNTFITDLIYKTMLNEKIANNTKKTLDLNILPQYDAVSILNSALVPITDLTNKTTGKDLVTETNNAVKMEDTGSSLFSLNQGNLTDIIVTVLSNKTTGKITIESNGGNFTKTTFDTVNYDALTETSYDIKVTNPSGNFSSDIKLSSQGKNYILGICGVYGK